MPVILNFTLTFEDYQNALRMHARKNWWLCLNYFAARFVVPILGVGFILLGLLISGHGVPWSAPIFLLCLGVLFVLYPLYFRARLKRCYRRTRTGTEQFVELGEEQIRIKSENTSSEIAWKAVQFFREDQKVFMLYLAPAKFIALPKRSFTPEQVSELEKLLARKVQRRS